MNIFRLLFARNGWQYYRLLDDSAVDRKSQSVQKREKRALNERITSRRNAATDEDMKDDVFMVARQVSKRQEYARLLEDLGL